jgi:hypothetical protein
MKEAKAKDASSIEALAMLKEKARCTRFIFSPPDTDRFLLKQIHDWSAQSKTVNFVVSGNLPDSTVQVVSSELSI